MRRPCCDKKHTNKGAWTRENQKLVDYTQTHGGGFAETSRPASSWQKLQTEMDKLLKARSKARGNFTEDEEDLIIKLHALLGSRWSLIAGRLPGRTDNEVKNYWNSHIRRKLITMGIDPNNHRLNQTIFHHKNDTDKSDQLHASPSIKSSSTANPDHDDEQLPDAATGLDDGTTSMTD